MLAGLRRKGFCCIWSPAIPGGDWRLAAAAMGTVMALVMDALACSMGERFWGVWGLSTVCLVLFLRGKLTPGPPPPAAMGSLSIFLFPSSLVSGWALSGVVGARSAVLLVARRRSGATSAGSGGAIVLSGECANTAFNFGGCSIMVRRVATTKCTKVHFSAKFKPKRTSNALL